MASAKYPLDNVKEILHDEKKVFFSVPDKSVNAIIAVYALTSGPKTVSSAKDFIFSGLNALSSGDFVNRTLIFDDHTVADVYGAYFDTLPWYIKFYVDEDTYLESVSFHPPEYEMQTVTGKLIKEGDWIYETMRKLWIKRN